MKNKFVITTLGCKVNQYESESIAESLKAAGWFTQNRKESADLCIINTCTVTRKASMQSRQAIRQIIRAHPDARVIVTGCYAQMEADEIRKIEGVDEIVAHADKHKISEKFQFPISNFQSPVSNSRTRPFLKIQDGCNAFCTYCIVPYARGRSRSVPPRDVLNSIRQLGKAGYHEVVLTGIHMGCYGGDLSPRTNLSELLYRIHDLNAVRRIRLSSIEPHELTDEILELAAKSEIFCRHFHIPLQSGDDQILKQMHRPYTSALFRELLIKIHQLMPESAIGADALIGFPGESEAAFENTYSLIEELPVTYLHVFPFSSRKGTPASKFPDKVPSKLIRTRCGKMRKLGNVMKNGFYKKAVGSIAEVLIEGKRDRTSGLLKGLTSNYIPVLVSGGDHLKNVMVNVRIREADENSRVFGDIVS